MRTSSLIKAPRPFAGRSAGELSRALAAAGVVLGVCALGAGLEGWGRSATSRSVQSHQESAAELRTGGLLVVSPSGERCRSRMIDNSTWQIRDIGWVNCQEALARSVGSESADSRLDLIRQSFRGHP